MCTCVSHMLCFVFANVNMFDGRSLAALGAFRLRRLRAVEVPGRFNDQVLLALSRRGGPAPTKVLGRGRRVVELQVIALSSPQAASGYGCLHSPRCQNLPGQWVREIVGCD